MKRSAPAALLLSLLLTPPAFAAEKLPATPGIENLIRITPGLYSGGEPHGAAAFDALQALGVRTLLSVDGMKPDVEAARARGMEYVHIPVGYDGIHASAAERIAAVMHTRPGPVYVHCHHGKHRGPAAAAIAWRCSTNAPASTAAASDLLREAGTDPKYDGLFASVRDFQPPAPAAVQAAAATLVPVVASEDLAASMARLSRHWDNLKAIKAAGWKATAEHPDLVPAREAVLALEGLKESARFDPKGGPDADYRTWMTQSLRALEALETGLRSGSPAADELEAAHAAASKSCADCHKKYRD
jgi:hypothetical protein